MSRSMMQSKLPPCAVCGQNNYIKQSGFYVCTNCDVQSQEIIDESFDYIGDNAARLLADDDRVEVTVSSEPQEEERQLTSWEVFNLILKRILNELIELGAPDEVRIVALQLWVQYLRNSGAAFTSKYAQKHPKLTAGFKERDAKILYGVKNLRQKIIGSHYLGGKRKRSTAGDTGSEASSHSSSISRKSAVSISELRRKQRKLAKSVLKSTDMDDTLVSDTESIMTLVSKNGTRTRKRVKVKFRSESEKKLNELVTRITSDTVLMNPNSDLDRKDERRYTMKIGYEIDRSKGTGKNMESLTMITILSIIRLSLLMLGHHIQLADLLRWIREGRLSMAKPDSFLAARDRLGIQPFTHIQRYGLQKHFLSTIRCMGIEDIQAPNLYELVERYCKELHLPKEFLRKVHSVMLAYPPVMKYGPNNYSSATEYECRCICYIIFVAKLLFGLNDYSEYIYSDLASKVNRYYEENHIKKQKLFSWREWTRYIECRKAVLSKFSTVQNQKYYNSRLSNEYNYINYWSRASTNRESTNDEAGVVDHVILDSMSKVMRKLGTNENQHNEFPATVTPLVDETNHILNTLSHMIPKSAVKILSRDFSNDGISFFIDDDRCRQACLDCGFEWETTLSRLSFKKYEPKETPHLPDFKPTLRGKLAHRRVKVTLTKTEFPSVPSELSKFNFECEKIRCNRIDQFVLPGNNPGKRAFPKREYWFFHNLSKLSNGEFQEITDFFPSSFLWLLKECSTMLEIHMNDIYIELVKVEWALYHKLVDNKNGVCRMRNADW